MDQLEQLRKLTIIVSDTGEINEIQQYKPTDATTNPSLIFSAASKPEYKHLVQDAIAWGKGQQEPGLSTLELIMEKVFVNFGLEILKIVPGRVSTEVDARLSFDQEGSMKKARRLIKLYEQAGISRDRILIKLASTWEGIRAAEQLEKEEIHCNMTLMFSLAQAIGCAMAGATLISPFVGRILDWYKKHEGKEYAPHEDPGVLSVKEIYDYYKHFGYQTQIMGASFRNVGEILELSGCDLLTVQPKFLGELQNSQSPVPRKLDPEAAKAKKIDKINLDEKTFRWMMCQNPMATEKLDEGIVNFTKDIIKLEAMMKTML